MPKSKANPKALKAQGPSSLLPRLLPKRIGNTESPDDSNHSIIIINSPDFNAYSYSPPPTPTAMSTSKSSSRRPMRHLNVTTESSSSSSSHPSGSTSDPAHSVAPSVAKDYLTIPSSSASSTLTISTSPSSSRMREDTPLLGNARRKDKGKQRASPNGTKEKKKPFYRARPLWLVPFAITAALVRGMTMAPRVEVFTQLACNQIYGRHDWNHTRLPPSPLSTFHISTSSLDPVLPPTLSLPFLPTPDDEDEDDNEDPTDPTTDPRRLPSSQCLQDPLVQSTAARLQTTLTTTMGLLSALTTSFWGSFGSTHGRTKVLAISTLGLFLTDLTFILVSTPGSFLEQHPHGHKALLVAPIVEGLLGGWSTLQGATSAYLSDCTSPGSRAHIFSRFTGVFYLGFSVGPSIGGWLISHPVLNRWVGGPLWLPGDGTENRSVTTVFWVAIICSGINLLLCLFVFPESLGKKTRERETGLDESPVVVLDEEEEGKERKGIVMRLLSPLAVFLPVAVVDPYGMGRKKRDWSLTVLACALFGFMLSTGVYQIKYLYATHTYGWGAEQLSYYISFMGGGRALFLLFLLPSIIGYFKSKPKQPPTKVLVRNKYGKVVMVKRAAVPAASTTPDGKKPKPTREQLGSEIAFDLTVAKCSFLVDIVSHTLVSILPTPSYHFNTLSKQGGGSGVTPTQSEIMFVLASSLNSMGSGAIPAIHSLALCMVQVRALDKVEGAQDVDVEAKTGELFGALAVLQAVGQMILGPLMFGIVYSETIAVFPKAVFVLAACLMVCAFVMVMGVKNPVVPVRADIERGRSRASKDLRGGAISPQ